MSKEDGIVPPIPPGYKWVPLSPFERLIAGLISASERLGKSLASLTVSMSELNQSLNQLKEKS